MLRFKSLLSRVLVLSGLSLGALLLAAVLLAPSSLAPVFADGSKSDNAIPTTWVGAPTRPKLTPCYFTRTTLTSWKVEGDTRSDYCRAGGVASHGLCGITKHCESYSNAALLGSEIWGYTWSDDSLWCHFDECGSADTAGYSWEAVIYHAPFGTGCSSSISGMLDHQFRWRVQGRGNVEVAVAGLMSCNGQDLKFPGHTITGGKAAYVGSRCACAPSDSGSITFGEGPISVTIPISKFESAYLPPDEAVVAFTAGANMAGPVPLGLLGEMIVFRGYSKVRSYADEPALGDADVEGWIRDANPGLTVTLSCYGHPQCNNTTTSTCKRKTK